MTDRGLERLKDVVAGVAIGPMRLAAGTNEDGYCVFMMNGRDRVRSIFVGLTDMAENNDDDLLGVIVKRAITQ